MVGSTGFSGRYGGFFICEILWVVCEDNCRIAFVALCLNYAKLEVLDEVCVVRYSVGYGVSVPLQGFVYFVIEDDYVFRVVFSVRERGSFLRCVGCVESVLEVALKRAWFD